MLTSCECTLCCRRDAVRDWADIACPMAVQYTAVPQRDGAPLRAITVKDAIGDLPPINNGSANVKMSYSGLSHVDQPLHLSTWI